MDCSQKSRNISNILKVVALTACGIFPASVMAQEVTLKSADGTVNLTGQLVKFENGNYTLSNELGELSISASRVRCEGEACPELDTGVADVKLVGSDTVGEGLMPLLMSGYATFLDAELQVENTATEGQFVARFIGDQGFGDPAGNYLVTSTASRDAFSGLLEGTGEIGMSSRRITPEEARALRDAGAGSMIDPSQEHIIAVDSLIIIVHPDNPANSISIGDLAKIYSGEYANWSQVGGPDMPINVITRAEGSGTLTVFQSRIFGSNLPPAPAGQVVAGDNNEAAALVNQDPSAISFVSYAFQRGNKALKLINECGIETSPDAFSVKTEEYSIQRRLYLYNRADASGDLVKKFLEFTASPVADQVISQSGFIDFGVISNPQDADSPRAAALSATLADSYEKSVIDEMLGKMTGTERLSTTFRFRAGSTKLDDRGLIDMQRLLEYLKAQPEGTKVTLVGFSDNAGEFDPNLDVAKGWAEIVAKELAAAGGESLVNVSIDATGFGEIAPVACNTSEAGRQTNRRVEVWISRS